jgi:TonB family protein
MFSKGGWSQRRASTGLVVGICLFFLGLPLAGLGEAANASEDLVKAAYLANFAKLTEWPRYALPEGSAPLVIGVSGGDEDFVAALKTVAAGKIIGTHPLAVKVVTSETEMKSCQIVFFRASEKKHVKAAIEGLGQAGVLLVGEDESFLRDGGMINLVRDHGSVHFEVNTVALGGAEIRVSPKILALARPSSGGAAAPPTNSVARAVQHDVPAEYPEIAQRMNLSGTVQMEAVVKADGTVKEVKILGGHPVLADAAMHAVMQWKYQPGAKETTESVKMSFAPK